MYYKLDNNFKLPKAIIKYNIYSKNKLQHDNPEFSVFLQLWEKMLDLYLKKFIYLAEMGKLKLSFDSNYSLLYLEFVGYSDKMKEFIESVGTKINNFILHNSEEWLKTEFEVCKRM